MPTTEQRVWHCGEESTLRGWNRQWRAADSELPTSAVSFSVAPRGGQSLVVPKGGRRAISYGHEADADIRRGDEDGDQGGEQVRDGIEPGRGGAPVVRLSFVQELTAQVGIFCYLESTKVFCSISLRAPLVKMNATFGG